MKISKKALLAVSAAFLLASCGAPNPGKEITKEAFAAAVESPATGIITHVKGKVSMKASGAQSGEESYSVDRDTKEVASWTQNETACFSALMACDPETIITGFVTKGASFKTYANEEEKTISAVVDANFTSGGINYTIQGQYTWNDHCHIIYADETQKMSANNQSITVVSHIEASYTY